MDTLGVHNLIVRCAEFDVRCSVFDVRRVVAGKGFNIEHRTSNAEPRSRRSSGMSKVTFQVLEGIDKGRVFRELSTPVTIGREEGNCLRLNDERVSRYHAKVQQDGDDIILTDLESTNGTRVNGNIVQIRRLRHGDRVCLGRSLLLFGSNEEIAARMADLEQRRHTNI